MRTQTEACPTCWADRFVPTWRPRPTCWWQLVFGSAGFCYYHDEMLDSDQFHLVDSGRLVGSLRVCKEHGRQRWGQICRVFLCQARRTSERASRSAPARQRNAWRPCLARRPSRWSCAFKGRAGCSGRWWCGGGGMRGFRPRGSLSWRWHGSGPMGCS